MYFVFVSISVMDYSYRYVCVEPALHSWDEANLIMVDKLFDVLLIQFARILLRIFALTFITDIGLKLYFLVVSLLGFGIRTMFLS